MDWIKKNFDKFILALFAVVLLGVSAMIFMNTSGFEERFSAAVANPIPNDTIPKVDTAVIDEARRQLEQPTIWKQRAGPDAPNDGLLFTATRYIADPLPKKVRDVAIWQHSRLKQLDPSDPSQSFIPNQWVLEHNFNPLNPEEAQQDSDGDGFFNEEEWLYKTDPNKKGDAPPNRPELWKILFLSKWVKVPFRLKFQAYEGDLKTPAKMTFQINTIDLNTPTQFPTIGETVATNFKIKKFDFKEKENPSTGAMDDVSELTLENIETGEAVVLIKDKVVDSPNQFATFAYYFVGAGISDGRKPLEFTVPKLKEFGLRPENTKLYKLLDVNATEAVVQGPQGEKIKIPAYPGTPTLIAPATAPAPAK